MIVYLMRWSNKACPSLGLYCKSFLIKFWIPAYFPSCGRWVILPVFKAGDIGDPNNYRGITVCSCLGKFFTLIINDHLTKYLDEHNIIHNNQIGFWKGYRTSDHVFVLKSLIDLYTKNDKKVYACFVDFQKAYDTIWRNGLFYMLMKYGFSQKILFLLKSMYDRVVSAVKVKSIRVA